MTSKYKLISTALLCTALSPLTHAGPPTSYTAVTYCSHTSDYSYEYGSSVFETVECTTPGNTRLNVPKDKTINIYAVSTRNQNIYESHSAQVPTPGYFLLKRNVSWGRDSVFLRHNFSGAVNISKVQNLGKTHTFFGVVRSDTNASWAYDPVVKLIISY